MLPTPGSGPPQPPRALHLGQLIVAAMAGGIATLIVEFSFGVFTKFTLLASFTGALFVSTLLATVAINQLPESFWGWFSHIPALPVRAMPFLFLGATIAGFLFGWLRW